MGKEAGSEPAQAFYSWKEGFTFRRLAAVDRQSRQEKD
jgi:hypothetical protein